MSPHAAYLRDALAGTGHGDTFDPASEAFARYYRVQRMWDRLMGIRTARMAAAMPADGLAILFVGSGHLAHGVGANLYAARETDLPVLSIRDEVVPASALDAGGRLPVAIGSADWVRVYRHAEPPVRHPSLAALSLAPAPDAMPGLRVERVLAAPASPLRGLRPDDVIRTLDGTPVGSATALRLAFEGLPPGHIARFGIERAGAPLEIAVDVAQSRL